MLNAEGMGRGKALSDFGKNQIIWVRASLRWHGLWGAHGQPWWVPKILGAIAPGDGP